MIESVIPAAPGTWIVSPNDDDEGGVECQAFNVTAWIVEIDGSLVFTIPIADEMRGFGEAETYSQSYRRPATDSQIVYLPGANAEEVEEYALGKFTFWPALIQRRVDERIARYDAEREAQEAARLRAQNGDAS